MFHFNYILHSLQPILLDGLRQLLARVCLIAVLQIRELQQSLSTFFLIGLHRFFRLQSMPLLHHAKT